MSAGVSQLTNGGSKALTVNGSITPQTFSYAPGAQGVVKITGLSILLLDGAGIFSKFGARNALTNGVALQWTISSTTSALMTLKDNADICTAFPHHQHFGSGAVLSILGIVTPQGFLNTTNVFRGVLEFTKPVILDGSNSDSISAIVQDDLSSLTALQLTALWEQ